MLRAALLALVVLGVLTAPAHAEPLWTPGTPLSQPAGGFGMGVAVAADARGGAVAVWLQPTGQACCSVVQAARRDPSGAWSAPVTLSRDHLQAEAPAVGIDDAGNAVLVWLEDLILGTVVRSRSWPAGAGIGPDLDLSFAGTSETPLDASDPVVAVNPAGAAVVAWRRATSTGQIRVQAVTRDRVDQGFGVPETLSPAVAPSVLAEPQPVIEGSGAAHVIWTRGGTAEVASRPARGEWSVQALGPGTRPALVLDPAGGVAAYGDAGAVYRWGTSWQLVAGARGAGGSFGTVLDTDGALFAAGNGMIGEYPGVYLTTALPGQPSSSGPFLSVLQALASRPARSPAGSSTELRGGGLVPSRAGGVLGYWFFRPRMFVTTYRPPGGEFQPSYHVVHPLEWISGEAHVARDEQGNATAVWQQSDASGQRVYTAQLDLAAPAFDALDVPESVLLGQPLEVHAAVSDRLSPVGVSWDFGDGATADGASASRTYETAGPRTVTVTATDGSGNTTRRTRTVHVQAPPPPPVRRVIDADGDGFEPPVDCADGDARIRPGTPEVLGNRVDENCDGAAEPYPVVRATALLTSQFLGDRRTRLLRLTIRDLAAGDTVTVRCTGRGCRKAMRHGATARRATKVLDLTRRVKGARLRPAAKLEVRITHDRQIGRVFTFVMRSGGVGGPRQRRQCLDPGVTRPRDC